MRRSFINIPTFQKMNEVLLPNGLAMPSKGFYSTSVSIYYKFSLLAFTFNLSLKPLLGIAFVRHRYWFSNKYLLSIFLIPNTLLDSIDFEHSQQNL